MAGDKQQTHGHPGPSLVPLHGGFDGWWPAGAIILDADLHRRIYMERRGGGSIVVSDYDPAWSVTFEQERTSLHTALGPLVLTVEHIGSTAVPGLAAKPIIDLQ
jgi:hypothetical protein